MSFNSVPHSCSVLQALSVTVRYQPSVGRSAFEVRQRYKALLLLSDIPFGAHSPEQGYGTTRLPAAHFCGPKPTLSCRSVPKDSGSDTALEGGRRWKASLSLGVLKALRKSGHTKGMCQALDCVPQSLQMQCWPEEEA